MTFILKLTRKVNSVTFVSRRIWAELAVWPTSKSGRTGWQWRCKGGGVSLTNPLFGCAATLMLGASK